MDACCLHLQRLLPYLHQLWLHAAAAECAEHLCCTACHLLHGNICKRSAAKYSPKQCADEVTQRSMLNEAVLQKQMLTS